jgi:hypothetical protein
MIHVFLLTVYLGKQIISQDMYFNDIDRCKYFAERLNKQPPVPNRKSGEDEPKFVSYVAVCAPKVVKPNNKIY